MKRQFALPRHFKWKALLLRFLLNALALALTALIIPQIYFMGDYRILTWLLISAAFGLLNAFVKPIVQFIMLPFLFVSYGLVVVVINSFMLILLAFLFPRRFEVGSLLWGFAGGAVFGVAAGLVENLLGLTPPVIEGDIETLQARAAQRTPNKIQSRLLAATEDALQGHTEPTGKGPAERGDS